MAESVRMDRQRSLIALLVIAWPVFNAGCNTARYYSQAIGGQWEISSQQRPIPEVICEQPVDSSLSRSAEAGAETGRLCGVGARSADGRVPTRTTLTCSARTWSGMSSRRRSFLSKHGPGGIPWSDASSTGDTFEKDLARTGGRSAFGNKGTTFLLAVSRRTVPWDGSMIRC